ncbi:hypothetical protein JW905_06290, partial [bacterium]|nr:hypothetical protein [candidate division CSSED10-310 bacterium]
LTALLCLVIVAKHGYRISRDPRHSGLGRNDAAYPDTAIALIDEWHIRGNVFNQYDLGSYLIWKWYPRRKVFIDGRNQVYPVEFFKEYLSVNASAANLDRVMDKYGIDCVLVVNQVPPPGSPRGVYNYLSESQVWRLVYWDDLHLMYLRDRPEYKEILKENEYRCYDPVLPPELTLGVNLLVRPQECLAELERAVRINPANVRARVLLMNSRKLLEQRKNTP